MAETASSVFDNQDTHSPDSDGEGTRPVPPLRGRGCGRKRKGTPVKVFVSPAEENNTGHSAGDPKESAEHQHQTPDGLVSDSDPHSCEPSDHSGNKAPCGNETNSSSASTPVPASVPAPARTPSPAPALSLTPASTAPATPAASAPATSASSSPPSPNCRIREVHSGSQVRLVVIAIRDITKGEEITVDYSLTEWGENLGYRGTSSAVEHESNSDAENNIKKEEENVPLTSHHQQNSDYIAPSWSLSLSSPPISHSEGSDDEDNLSGRGRTQRRRKKRRGTILKKRTPQTPPGRSTIMPPQQQAFVPTSSPHCVSPSSTKSDFKAPTPLGCNSNTTNVPKKGPSADSIRQTCEYCGRHFRSLGRHLDKHHAHQPDVCSALVERYTQMPHLNTQNTNFLTAHPHSRSSQSRGGVPDFSMSPPHRQSAVAVSVLKRSPPPVSSPPHKKGVKRIKKERQDGEGNKGVDEELLCPRSELNPHMEAEDKEYDEDEEEGEEHVDGEDDSGGEGKEPDLMSSGRHQMLPLLSSLSSLVLYLRRLQHSAFLSLSRQLQSSEAWRLLCHSSLALLILYNRRRECEVSKLLICEYRARVTPQCPVPVPPGAPPALTPLEASLSPFERLVLPHLPRVGVQGKRGRIQPLILPPHCEPCLELLLETRHDVGVDPANPYVFARPYHSPATPLRGTDLLRSLARSSGTRNPRALTQTRVRRQVAILTQLLLLGEGEVAGQVGGGAVERLENFLEKEYHVTQCCSEIGQDPGLMGRVGRVVLCGERDGVLFRGMSLNHICLELDVMSGNSADSFSEGESDGERSIEVDALPEAGINATSALLYMKKAKNNGRVGRPKKVKSIEPLPPLLPPLPVKSRRGSGKRGVLKRPWSEAERAAVEEHLTQNITEMRVPAKADCERCLQQCPLLVSNQRDWRAIKFYCHNRIQLLKKNMQRENEPLPLTVC
ncbi:uncharacterized protein ACB058_014659 [Synchiropus picturatus]